MLHITDREKKNYSLRYQLYVIIQNIATKLHFKLMDDRLQIGARDKRSKF